MSAYTRYKILKKMNYNSIVLLKGGKKYLTFEKDLQLLNCILVNDVKQNTNKN